MKPRRRQAIALTSKIIYTQKFHLASLTLGYSVNNEWTSTNSYISDGEVVVCLDIESIKGNQATRFHCCQCNKEALDTTSAKTYLTCHDERNACVQHQQIVR
jgi:hypothetical protein